MTLLLLLSGVLPWFQSKVTHFNVNPIVQGVIFFFVLIAMLGVLQYPLGLYETFRIEGSFGFNRMTLKLYVVDTLKTVVISVIIGAPFLYAVLWFMNFSGHSWWIWVFLFLTGFQVVMILLYPSISSIQLYPWVTSGGISTLDD